MKQTLLTPTQKRKDALHAAVLARWKSLTENPQNSKEEICRVICREYGVSRSCIYALRKKHGLV